MKHFYIKICTMALALMSCTISQAQTIGILMDSYVVDRWYLDQQLLEKKIKELGGESITKVPFGDPQEQIRLGKELIDQKVDALIVVPSDAKQAAAIVEYAKKFNIPVLSYDRMILSKDVSFYVSYDNIMVGKLQAEYSLKQQPKGNYLLINGPEYDNNAKLFRKGQMEVLKPHIYAGDIQVIGDVILEHWSELESLMKTDELLTSISVKPDVIIAANDALARGALNALPLDLVKDITLCGQDAEIDAIKYIIKGQQDMTIYKPIEKLAHTAAEVAITLAKNEKVKNYSSFTTDDFTVDAILLEPIVVDKTNYKTTVIKDGHISMSELVDTKR